MQKASTGPRILNVFNHIPAQLAKDNKKFQISKVASGAQFPVTIEDVWNGWTMRKWLISTA